MESFLFTYPARKSIDRPAHVGVVGSGDLEIILEPNDQSTTEVSIRTHVTGHKATWEAVIQRFFEQHDIAANVKINDFGATPGMVAMRLAQAVEVSSYD
ncbi:malonate decarboxylase subunit delta [Sporosarcina sp. GW1-11]|uniref:malonate decarboxylase subunit delta n=1 Tax=Sporosarcina sp. GW1-11 TaxID=2899126 RepID=UPI00294D9A65|nr:malonate decarboxylase subunit delta [Sporosarcina sp. GW1-11]MDV6378578.1 malonate decarboxylase subunit delta [Sporosarcina sp. GW1-11]